MPPGCQGDQGTASRRAGSHSARRRPPDHERWAAPLAKILKGARTKDVLAQGLDASPVYGYYRDLRLDDIRARIDWVILNGFLSIEYDYRLPLLVYTDSGWEIERETYANELLQGFDQLPQRGAGPFDMTYLKDRDRGLILLLLDKVEQTGDPKYIPPA